MSDDAAVLHEKRGSAFRITINRPDRRNAITLDVIAGIRAGWSAAEADPDIRVIILTGAGDKAFCAGGDLQPGGFAFDLSQPTMPYADMLRQIRAASKPSIARVNGACMAGGIGLLCMTDLAVATDTATFGLPEVKIGLFPMQVLSLLQRLVPPRIAAEWCLTGEPFGAAEAKAAGLINHIVPPAELDARTDWLAARLAGTSPAAIRRGKYVLRAAASMSFEEALAFTESQFALAAMTEDAKEGLAAFAEKRPPVWPGP